MSEVKKAIDKKWPFCCTDILENEKAAVYNFVGIFLGLGLNNTSQRGEKNKKKRNKNKKNLIFFFLNSRFWKSKIIYDALVYQNRALPHR